jgi:cytochrome c-type biogenesis protein CcmH/NrfG
LATPVAATGAAVYAETQEQVVNKRLEMLEKMLASGSADSFARYALAMEYRKEKRVDDSLRAFEALREVDPSYLPMYLMAGQLLIEAERASDAKPWLEAGIVVAKQKGDGKALSELESALAGL